MPHKISRRTFLTGTLAAGSAMLLPGARAARAQETTVITPAEMIDETTQAAAAWLDLLDGPVLDSAMFVADDPLSQDWNWMFQRSRPGVPLGEMTDAQAAAALALLATGMSESGYTKALDIMALQSDLGRDPHAFWFRVFGEPGAARWGWTLIGHHLVVNTRIIGDEVFTTPMFLGAQPTVTTREGEQYRVMDIEELTARELVLSLGADAIYSTNNPRDILGDQSYQMERPAAQGVPTATFTEAQLTMLDSILETYISAQPAPSAEAMRQQVEDEGLTNLTFGWTGSTQPSVPHTYAVFGESFLLTYNNVRHSGNHIHSVWRNFEDDFGFSRL